jgi:hypothetical protein
MASLRRTRKNTQHLEVAEALDKWAAQYGQKGDPYIAALTSDLIENKNLPMWATMDPMDYLPTPSISGGYSAVKWTRLMTVIRNVLVFAPVALTWFAVGKATEGFSKYVKIHGTDVVNFLDFWQNGYGTLAKEWTIGRVATLDFAIIFLVIALTLAVSVTGKRATDLQESSENQIDRDRVAIAVALHSFLFDKKSVTTLTINASMANVLTKLLNAADSLEATTKSLEKSTKKLPITAPAAPASPASPAFDLYSTPAANFDYDFDALLANAKSPKKRAPRTATSKKKA